MTILSAHHTGLHVGDLERSLTFYRDLLGFEIAWERETDSDYVQRLVGCPGATLCQVMLMLPGSQHQLELIEYRTVDRAVISPHPPTVGTAHVCLTVDDLETLYLRLGAAGVSTVSEPLVVPHGPNAGRVAVYAIDPDGFRIELLEVQPTPSQPEPIAGGEVSGIPP